MRGRKYAEGACGLGIWGCSVGICFHSNVLYGLWINKKKKLIHTYLVSLPFENCLQKDSHYFQNDIFVFYVNLLGHTKY